MTPVRLGEYKLKEYFLGGIITLTIAFSLWNSDLFYYHSLTAYHFYNLGASLLVVATGLFWLMQPDKNIKLGFISLFTIAWFLYIISDGVLHRFNVTHTYYLFSFLFLLGLIICRNLKIDIWQRIYRYIVFIATMEACICLFQWLGIFKNNNTYFKVTGTWDNPNVIAMFLAMIIPLTFIIAINDAKKFYKYLLAIQLLALVSLNCRTAFIGAAIAVGLTAIYQYSLLNYSPSFFKPKKIIIGIISAVTIVAVTSYYQYHAKQASADGRLFVWRNSLAMIKANHYHGVGYDCFEQRYNLYQASLVKSGAIPQAQWNSAGSVKMAYNELLQAWAEGGIIGIITLLATFVAFIIIPIKKRLFIKEQISKQSKTLNIIDEKGYYVAAYAGIVCFVSMSMLNFTFQAIPCMAMLMIYMAAVIHYCSVNRKSIVNNEKFGKYQIILSRVFACTLILVSLSFGFIQVKTVYADHMNKEARELTAIGNADASLKILPGLQTELSTYTSYWKNYAVTLIMAKKYASAIDKLAMAKKLSSDPLLYDLSGYCNERLRRYAIAGADYQQAIYLEPYKFKSRIAKMRVLLMAQDTANAVKEANTIYNLTPKIMSSQVMAYKQMAMQVLKMRGGDL